MSFPQTKLTAKYREYLPNTAPHDTMGTCVTSLHWGLSGDGAHWCIMVTSGDMSGINFLCMHSSAYKRAKQTSAKFCFVWFCKHQWAYFLCACTGRWLIFLHLHWALAHILTPNEWICLLLCMHWMLRFFHGCEWTIIKLVLTHFDAAQRWEPGAESLALCSSLRASCRELGTESPALRAQRWEPTRLSAESLTLRAQHQAQHL